MDLANKEEVIAESLKCIDIAIEKIPNLNDSYLENIKEILVMCVKFGFEKGALHGEYASNQRLINFIEQAKINSEVSNP